MGSSNRALSQDTVYDILSNPRRRYILYYLRQGDQPVKLTTLAEHVAAWENETDVESLEEQQRKRVYVSLYQTHIPKLDDAGLVEYDSDAGTVALAEGATAIDSYLTQPENGVSWQTVYLIEAFVGAIALALTASDLAVFALLPETAIAVVIVLALLITVVVQLVVQRRRRTVPLELRRQT